MMNFFQSGVGMYLSTGAAFVVALGLLITFHEFGHYLVARLCNVRVLRFAIGFGPPLWKKVIGSERTEWAIGAIPLGGYVKMLDEREGEVLPAELHRAFNRQNVWRRFAIVIAGPLANFLLAVALYSVLFMHGVQEVKPIIAEPPALSAAALANLPRGATVLKINGEPVTTWQEMRWKLLQLAVAKSRARLEVINPKQEISLHELDLTGLNSEELDGEFMRHLGLLFNPPEVRAVIGSILPGSAAERAGMQLGDQILRIGDEPITQWTQVSPIIQKSAEQPLSVLLQRGSQQVQITLTPDAVSEQSRRIGRMGAGLDPEVLRAFMTETRYGPLESIPKAIAKTWDTSVFSLRMMGKLLTGDVSWRNISGPVTIADIAGQSARRGLTNYLDFLALISISLGVLNLLPIPLLDGGHLMYYVIEMVRGRPVSERVLEIGQQVGMFLLLTLMAFAFYNDISRLLSS